MEGGVAAQVQPDPLSEALSDLQASQALLASLYSALHRRSELGWALVALAILSLLTLVCGVAAVCYTVYRATLRCLRCFCCLPKRPTPPRERRHRGGTYRLPGGEGADDDDI